MFENFYRDIMQNEVLFDSAEEYERFVSENSSDPKDTVFRFDLLVDDGSEHHFGSHTACSRSSVCNWEFKICVAKNAMESVHIFIEDHHFVGDFALNITVQKTNGRLWYSVITFKNCTFNGDIKLDSKYSTNFEFEQCKFADYRDVAIIHDGGESTKISFSDSQFERIRLTQVGEGTIKIDDDTFVRIDGISSELWRMYSNVREFGIDCDEDYAQFHRLGTIAPAIWREIYSALMFRESRIVKRGYEIYHMLRCLRDKSTFKFIDDKTAHMSSEDKVRYFLKRAMPESEVEVEALFDALLNFKPKRSIMIDRMCRKISNDGRSVRPNGL